jgi:biotin carboxylase
VIQRSCGDLRYYDVITDKIRTLEVAASLGIHTPEQAPASDLDAFSTVHGYPLLIKMSIGMAGKTVRACANSTAATAAIAELQSLQIPSYILPSSLIVQKYVDGYQASISFVALDGSLLDSFTYRTEVNAIECGPSCIIKRINHPEIERIARQLIAHFGFTGFGGFDFMVDSGSGAVNLLEMNPRVTLTSHLGGAFGHDLSRALLAALTGGAKPDCTDGNEVVAIFPQEWWRDADSPHLKRYFSDVPWNDPNLLNYVISKKPTG